MDGCKLWIIKLFAIAYVAAQGPGTGGPQNCPRNRIVQGVRCGTGGQTCPTSSSCIMTETGSGVCCWEAQNTIEAPCLDPLMQNDQFVTCASDNPCPGSCHNCRDLSGVGLGLCCPDASRAGCSDTAPNQNLISSSQQSLADARQGRGEFAPSGDIPAGQSQSTFPVQDTASAGGQFGTDAGGFQTNQAAQPQVPISNPCPGGARPFSRCRGVMCPMGSQCYPYDASGGVCCAMGTPMAQQRDPRRFMEQRFMGGFRPGMGGMGGMGGRQFRAGK